MSDSIYFLVLIRLRIYWCPHHYEYRNYSGEAWWYSHSQLVSGEIECIKLHYKCFHPWVLAGNDVGFDRSPGFDLTKNILVPPPHYEFRNHRGVAWCCHFGNWYVDSLSICHFTTSAFITEYWQGMMSDLIDILILIHLRTYWCPHQYEFRNYNGVAWW